MSDPISRFYGRQLILGLVIVLIAFLVKGIIYVIQNFDHIIYWIMNR